MHLFGCEIRLRFPGVKLLDYRDRRSELETSENPFGIVVRAYLKAQETAKDPSARLDWKWRLIRELYQRGLDRDAILNMFRFIDWIMQLPEELEQAFRDRLDHFEVERKMPYVTSIERLGKEEGLLQGRQEGGRTVLQKMLIHRFGPLPDWAIQRLDKAGFDDMERWIVAAMDAPSLDDVLRPHSH